MSELQDLKVGDAVAIVQRNAWNGRIHLTKGAVEKTTKTQVIAFGRRFKVATGREVGASTSRFSVDPILRPLTPELLAEEAEALAEQAAEQKCFRWSDKLKAARGAEAVALANMLPEVPE